ncbi:carbohydrate porin [Sphingomonas sp. PR090111-T3T-6A]|uniref:carbohydrate porin n=1 Tax=Sphingomonas sp. PR090111-T3T-6A TaxID=685778 RepID=UPI00035FE6A9|nr:carbohydrate porin [Sphingomonas sp. PR090111-T3T-6A]
MLALAVARPAWAGDPPSVSASYITDVIGNASGGVERGVDWIGRLDLTVASGDRLFGIDGAHAQFDMMLLHGGGFSAVRTGDGQVLDNIDAPHAVRPFEAWISVPLTPRLRAKAGLVDLNSEFDPQNVGTLFLNSSFGIGPDLSQAGLDGPSIFPVTAPGMVLAYEPAGWSARLGVFDALAGDPEHLHRVFPDSFGRHGALVIGQASALIGPVVQAYAGAWAFTDPLPRIDAPGEARSAGGYVEIEARLLDDGPTRALKAWVRAGKATERANPIGTYVGGGFTWGGDRRMAGIAVARAILGDPAWRAGQPAVPAPYRAETAWEITARERMGRGLFLQPDMQYIVHPGWAPSVGNALVLALRLQWNWLGGH